MELNIDEVFRKEYNNVRNYIRIKTNNNPDTEDLTSEVFKKVCESKHTYDHTKKLSNWLLTIANNVIIDNYRKNKNDYKCVKVSEYVNEDGKEIFQYIAPSKVCADYNINNNEILTSIDKAIDKLPNENLKQVAKLLFKDDLKYTEIAEILCIPLGSIKGMIFRVRELLQIELKDLYNVRSKINVEIL